MDTLTYLMLIGAGIFAAAFLLLNERKKYQRFQHNMQLQVELQFQERGEAYDHMRRGSILLHLRKNEGPSKAIVIRKVAFSDSAFVVSTLDKLYFRGGTAEPQLLSASFRIRRHALRKLAGKQLSIQLSGWINDNEGNKKPFKARIPYTVEADQDVMPKIARKAV